MDSRTFAKKNLDNPGQTQHMALTKHGGSIQEYTLETDTVVEDKTCARDQVGTLGETVSVRRSVWFAVGVIEVIL